jgi:hypothetical protein
VTAATALPGPAAAKPAHVAQVSAECAPVDARFISPAFLEARDAVYEAIDAWYDCCDECDLRDKAFRKWHARNPLPGYLPPDEPGYSPTARSDWSIRQQGVMVQLGLGKIKAQRNELAKAHASAVQRLAGLEARTPSELFLKVGVGMCADNGDRLVARSVLRDLFFFQSRLFPDVADEVVL